MLCLFVGLVTPCFLETTYGTGCREVVGVMMT